MVIKQVKRAISWIGGKPVDEYGEEPYRCIKCGESFSRNHSSCPECGNNFLAKVDE